MDTAESTNLFADRFGFGLVDLWRTIKGIYEKGQGLDYEHNI